jgi:hypothetical protein
VNDTHHLEDVVHVVEKDEIALKWKRTQRESQIVAKPAHDRRVRGHPSALRVKRLKKAHRCCFGGAPFVKPLRDIGEVLIGPAPDSEAASFGRLPPSRRLGDTLPHVRHHLLGGVFPALL